MNSNTLEVLIKNRVKEVIANSNGLFPKSLNFDNISYKFNLRGTCAGKACTSEMRLYFNLILAEENLTTFLNDTVPHEIAHLYQGINYPRSKPHGHEWKLVMVKMGFNPDRCHHYDVSTIKANRKPKMTYTYSCPCGKKFELSSNLHTRIQNKKSAKICIKCRKPIFYCGDK